MPVLSTRAQLLIGLALAALLAMTRGHHFASLDHLPSASWAVFFLAGIFLRSRWAFAALFLEAVALDFGALANGAVSDWCLSPAYWLLLPAYGALWLGGRLFVARAEQGVTHLAVTLLVSAFVAHLISSGGFYFFSGRYPEPTLAAFVERIGWYFPRSLANMALYVSLAAILQLGLSAFFKPQSQEAAQ